MDIELNKELFLEALTKTQGIVERRTVTPALSHAFLKIDPEGKVTIEATDMDLSLRTSISAKVTLPGEAVFSARKALEIVKEIDDETIFLKSTDPQWMTITAGKSNFKLVCLSPEDFPPLPEPASQTEVEMEVATFQEIIRKTAFAASQEESRYAINGVLLEMVPQDGGIEVIGVATDGHRLALYKPTVKGGGLPGEVKCLVPRRTLVESRRLFPLEGGKITIGLGEKGISLAAGETILMSRLIQGQFPDYQGVVEVESSHRVVVNREDLIHSVRRVSVMGDERVRQVRIDLTKNTAQISSSHPELGEAVEQLEVEFENLEMNFSFNASYLLEGLKVIDTEKVVLTMGGDFKPCLMRGEGEENFSYVVMPMRI